MTRTSIARLVRDYIDTHPSIQDCVRGGIVNNSALARRIIADLGLDSEDSDAVIVACRRYEQQKKPDGENNDERIRAVVAASKIQITSKTAIIIAKNSWQIFSKLEKITKTMTNRRKTVRIVQSSAIITIIVEEALLDDITAILGDDDILKTQTGLVELAVTSPETIEETAGVIAHLASTLAQHGINVVETMSCYTDTIFVVEGADMTRAFEILNGAITQLGAQHR